MVSKMKEVLFKDFITLKRGYDLPTKKRIPGTVPIVSSSGITGVHNDSKVQGPGVITGRSGLIGEIFYTKENFWPLNTTLYVKNFKNNCPEYVYYFLKTLNLNNYQSGSSVPTLNRNHLNNIKIKIHDIKDQVKISNILTNIDEKIENNNNTLANLEELSQTLFKRWFIDFEFPDENGNPYKSSGGKFVDTDGFMLPANWSVEPLDNIAQYTNGLAMQKYKPKDENDKLPVVKIKELKNGFVDDSSAFCTHSIPDKVKIFNGDIVFSWSATLLVDIWTGGPAGLNQHLFKVTSDKFQKWFYYYWTSFHNKNFIEIAKDKATTMGHINRKHLKEAKVFIPEEKILQKLDYQMSLYLKEIVNINLQNKSLAELRDTLLPKLMSGEIELPDELEVDEHAELLQ